jgi:hypothetical protein
MPALAAERAANAGRAGCAGWRRPALGADARRAQLAASRAGDAASLDARDEPSYRTLGAYAPAPTRDAIAVMFDPAITEARCSACSRARARIVDGPTTTNAFVLEVPAAQCARPF